MDRVTIYPSKAGGFPPASFWDVAEAMRYMRQMQDNGAACGLCLCPAASYPMHYDETLK